MYANDDDEKSGNLCNIYAWWNVIWTNFCDRLD